jgi:hypothetical protein
MTDISHMELATVIALIVAVAPILTGLGAALGAWLTNRTKAKQTELDALRDRVDELTCTNTQMHRENISLREYILVLTGVLREHGIEVPPMPRIINGSEP